MNTFKLIELENKILHSIAFPVFEFNDELKTIVEKMKNTMIEEGGIGIAAPQVGIDKRIIILKKLKSNEIFECINPIIIEAKDWMWHNEGCLSLPGMRVRKLRNKWIKFGYFNQEGKYFEMERENLEAACVQHEIDHLNGILMCDLPY